MVVGGVGGTLEVAGVEVLGFECCWDGFGWQCGEVPKVIDGCAEGIVTIAEGVGGVGVGVEAEGALAHGELDGAKGERGLRCIVDGDAEVSAVVEVGGDDGREGKLRGTDGGGMMEGIGGASDSSDLAVDDLLRLVGQVRICGGGDGDGAEEVGFVGGVEDKLDALNGDVGGDRRGYRL